MGGCASVDSPEEKGEGPTSGQTRARPHNHHSVVAHEDVVPAVAASGPYARLCNGSRGCQIPNPSERAITLRQLQHVFTCAFERCKEEGWTSTDPSKKGEPLTIMSMTLRDIVENFVKPATANGDRSLVEMLTTGPQRPMWYVSHWWGEPMHDLLSSLEQHAHDHGTSDKTTYWVSAFANTLDLEHAATTVRETARFQAMDFSEGLVTVVDRDAIALTRARVCFEMYVALVELPPSYKIDVYTTVALDPDQPLHRPGHASPAAWLRPKAGGAQHVGWKPLRWAVGLVDGLLSDVRLMGPMIATQAKARRERAFPMTTHAVARQISIAKAGATSREDKEWIGRMLRGKEDLVDATLRARLGVAQLPSLLSSREQSGDPLFRQYLSALRKSQLRRLAVACTDWPPAERLAQLGEAMPPCLEELSLHQLNGSALVPTLCERLRMRTDARRSVRASARERAGGDGAGAAPARRRGSLPGQELADSDNNGMPYNGLRRVTMRSCQLADADGVAIAAALGDNDTLRALVLRDAAFTDTTAAAFATALAANSTLQALKLPRSLIGDAGAAAIGGALQRNGALLTLSLNSTCIGEAGVVALARGLASNVALRVLNLRQNTRFGDKGAAAIGAALAQNPGSALRELDLSACGAGDDCARALGDALTARRAEGLGLTKLVLSKNCIGERGARALASALRAHAKGADSLLTLHVYSQHPELADGAKTALRDAWAHGRRAGDGGAELAVENHFVVPKVIKIAGRPRRRKFTPKFNHAPAE